MAQCFNPDKNEQGMKKFKLEKGKSKNKERILSSPPAQILPPAVQNMLENKRSVSLDQILPSTPLPKAPQSPGLRNISRRDQSFVTICVARAMYDYPSKSDLHLEDDEEVKLLRFCRGDEIQVFEKDASGWWAGKCGGHKGIFPGSYVKAIDDPEILRAGRHRLRSKTASPLIISFKSSTRSPSLLTSTLASSPLSTTSSNSNSTSNSTTSSPFTRTAISSVSTTPMSTVSGSDSISAIFASTFAVSIPDQSAATISAENRLERLFEKAVPTQLQLEAEIAKYKEQLEEKDKQIEKLNEDLASKTKENQKLHNAILKYDADHEKSVVFQKQLIEVEISLACQKAHLESLSREIQEADQQLQRTKAQVAEQQAKLSVIPEEINVAAVKKSLKLQHQLKLMKVQLDEETASRRNAEVQISESQKQIESLTEYSKMGFNLKIVNKINMVLTGILSSPDLTTAQIIEMIKKLKTAVSALILAHSNSSSSSSPLSSSPSSASPLTSPVSPRNLTPLSPPTTGLSNA